MTAAGTAGRTLILSRLSRYRISIICSALSNSNSTPAPASVRSSMAPLVRPDIILSSAYTFFERFRNLLSSPPSVLLLPFPEIEDSRTNAYLPL